MYFKSFTDLYTLNGFSFNEAQAEVSFLLEILYEYTYKDFLLGKKLSPAEIKKAENIIKERVRTKCPIQQYAGQSFFLGRRFYVNKYTLIPRPETELLVLEVLKCAHLFKNPEILDIGTGSGCIGISLMIENPDLKADMSDIQENALKTAEKNAVFHKTSGRSGFIKSNLFQNIRKKYDIIVSNPPYIPLKDKDGLQIEVREFEPAEALFTQDEYGVEFYEKIALEAHNFLKPKGIVAFELGINQSEKAESILKKNGFSQIKVTKDYNNIDRIITAANFIV